MTMGIQQLMWQIERVRDTFHVAVHEARDVDAATACVGEACTLVNTPIGTGADDPDAIRRYLAEDVLPFLPDDLVFERVSRTVDQRRVVDEMRVRFTHDRELPWLLPGVRPTGEQADVLAVGVVSFRHRSSAGRTVSLISAHRTLWDHAGLCAQLGVDPSVARPGATARA
jgi:carboxymethylenebutenolidase